MSNINQKFKGAVRALIAKGNHVKWGESDSVAVIVAMATAIGEESGLSAVEATALGEALAPYAAKVVNPSAFAQGQETMPDGSGFDAEGKAENLSYDSASDSLRLVAEVGEHVAHPAYIRRPKRGSGGAKSKIST